MTFDFNPRQYYSNVQATPKRSQICEKNPKAESQKSLYNKKQKRKRDRKSHRPAPPKKKLARQKQKSEILILCLWITLYSL